MLSFRKVKCSNHSEAFVYDKLLEKPRKQFECDDNDDPTASLLSTNNSAMNTSSDAGTVHGDYTRLIGFHKSERIQTIVLTIVCVTLLAVTALSMHNAIKMQGMDLALTWIQQTHQESDHAWCCSEQISSQVEPGQKQAYRKLSSTPNSSRSGSKSGGEMAHKPGRRYQVSAAHVSGPVVGNKSTFADIEDWKITDSRNAFCSDILHKQGRLVVPHDGVYFVYSQVQFIIYPSDEVWLGKTGTKLEHHVYRWNDHYPNDRTELLMKRETMTRWGPSSDLDEKVSYQGGVYSLSANDELFVRVSKHILNDSSTFFGIFATSYQS